MKKYIGNLNPKTKILNEFVYKTYRNDYLKKNVPNKKNQDLKEIRLNYYLKTVVSIMKTEKETFSHSKINFEYKPIDLYNKINEIKNNYDTNIESKLQEKDNKNTYFINCHGGYFKNNLKLYTVPDNVIIHFLTPLNYLSYIYPDEYKILHQKLKEISKNTDNTINNIKDLLKIDCFQNMITFLPGQKCFDINLSITSDDKIKFNNNMGIYNNGVFITNELDDTLSNIIQNDSTSIVHPILLTFPEDIITNIYINCCRSCNNSIDYLTIETMYIYENFIKQLNNSLLNIEEPMIIKETICKNSFTRKETIRNNLKYYGNNKSLSGKKEKTNSPLINKIINFYIKNKFLTTIESVKQSSQINDEINKGEFLNNEIRSLLNYIISDKEKLSIIDFIYDNLNDPEKKNNFINDFYFEFVNIKESYLDIDSIFMHYVMKKYIDILIEGKDLYINPLIIAVEKNNFNIVELLLKHPKITVNVQNKYNETPLDIALTRGYTKIVELLLKRDEITVNVKNYSNKTPLHIASFYGRTEIVELLLKRDEITVNVKNKYDETPLHIALKKGHTDIVELLLKRDEIDVNVQNKYDETPLHIASFNDRAEFVKLLLAHPGVDVNVQNHLEETPLHIASSDGHTEIVKLLLTHPKIDVDVDVNVKNHLKETPLHMASSGGHTDIVELLLKRDEIDVNVQNKNEDTPLHIAEFYSNTKIVELLKEHPQK